jgi:thiamine biosynthesis protein ThiS
VRLILNGEARLIDAVTDIAGLISLLNLDARRVAIERNRIIVPRSLWSVTALLDGDNIEIVHFVGGG